MKHYDDHPLAELFPLMEQAEIQALADDIKANGMKSKISLLDGKILDGRNRYRACLLAEVEPVFVEFKGSDPLAHVVSLNLHRRQLTASQRAMVAAKIAALPHGGDRKSDQAANVPLETQEGAAKKLHVSPRYVRAAKQIIDESPKKAAQVERGEKTIHAAQMEIKKEAAKPKNKANLPNDDRGNPLPAHLVALWGRRNEPAELAGAISRVRVTLRKAQNNDDPLYKAINYSTALAHLDQAYSDLIAVKPYCACPMCQGEGCRACRGVGLIGKFAFETIIPKELKKPGEK